MSNQEIFLMKEKEKKLLEKIERAKQSLIRFQNKRKNEVALLACKYGLNELSNEVLEEAFSKLAKEFMNGNVRNNA